jgi:hypothetical protein
MGEDLELRGRIIGGTGMDIVFEEEGGDGRVYLPRDQIAVVHQADGMVKVTLPVWLAKKKGFY